MTNHFHAKAERVDGTWQAQVRYCHRAGYETLMDGGRPVVFATEQEAEIAALRENERHINGTVRVERSSTSHGDEDAQAELVKVFGAVPARFITQGRTGKKIPVEMKRRRA